MNLDIFLKEFVDNFNNDSDLFYEKLKSELNCRFDLLSNEVIMQCGIRLVQMSYYSYAISVFNNLIEQFSKQNLVEGIIACIINKGIIFQKQGLTNKSISQYLEAAALAETHQKYFMLADVYGNLAIHYDIKGEQDESIMYANKALELFQNNNAGKIACLIILGSAYKNKGEFTLSIEYSTRALTLSEKMGDQSSKSNCLTNLSIAYELMGKHQEAFELNEQAICLKKEIKDIYGLSNCLMNHGRLSNAIGDLKKAVFFTEASLEIKEKIGDMTGKANCLENLGVFYNKIKDYNKGIEFFKQALTIRLRENNHKRISYCYQTIVNCYKLLGDIENATMFQQEFSTINSDTDILKVFNENISKGILARKNGEYSKAIELFKQSLSYAIEFGWKDNVIKSKLNLGNVYQNIGKFDDAITEYKEVMQTCIELNDIRTVAICYQNIGSALIHTNKIDEALHYTEKSIELFEDNDDKVAISRSLINMGNIYLSKNEPQKALTYFLQSCEIKQAIKDNEGLINCFINIGSVYFSLHDFDNSIKYNLLALDNAKEAHLLEAQKVACLNLGKSYNRINNNDKSFFYLKLAVLLINDIVDKLHYQDDIISYISSNAIYFQYIIPQVIEYNRHIAGFNFLENCKSQSLIWLLSHKIKNHQGNDNGELNNLVTEESNILENIIDLEKQNIQYGKIGNPNELSSLNIRLNSVRQKIRLLDYNYYISKTASSLEFDEIHKSITGQSKPIVLLEFYTASDATYIFIISSRESKIYVEKVNISFENVIRFVDNYNTEMGSQRIQEEYWLELSILLNSVEKYLDKNDIVYIIPFGVLHLIPIHALILNGKRFIEKYTVLYSPSASLLAYLFTKKSTQYKTCTSFGVDTVGNVRDIVEVGAKSLASLFDSNIFIGSNALKANLINGIDTDILSFLCHGYFNSDDPQLSGLNLFEDNLTVRDVFQINFNVNLVALTACTSGFNRINLSDDCVGLTSAFLYAGASSVTNCLRNVDANVAKEFMFDFFKQLKDGILKAEAFRNTTIKIMNKYTHAQLWSPFTLVGNWY